MEVCLDQRWGTVNGDGWSTADTQVVCRQLGYLTASNDNCILYSTQSLIIWNYVSYIFVLPL